MIKAVIFDSDGMLSHGPRFSEQYAADHKVSIDVLTPFFIGPFKDCLIGRADLKEELQKGWLEKWGWTGSVDELLEYWFSVGDQLDQEVFDTIAPLRARGVICVLATNQEKYRTEYLSKKFGYGTAFDKVFSSAYLGHTKTSPEALAVIMKYLNDQDPSIDASNTIFWDDDLKNIEQAKAYGLPTEQFIDAVQYKARMRELGLLA